MSANGRLTDSELTLVDGVRLDPTTAIAWARMKAACHAATGVTLDIVNYWGGYRDRAMQQQLRDNPPKGVRVAAVGASTHGLGRAVDVTFPTFDTAAGWLRVNARTYGFALGPANDRNHLSHNGTSTGPEPEETPMTLRIIKNADDTADQGSKFLWWPDGSFAPQMVGESTAAIYRDAGIAEYNLERGRWLWLLEQAQKDAQKVARGHADGSTSLTDADVQRIAQAVSVPSKGTITFE